VLGSDIDRGSLEAATGGIVPESALGEAPAELRAHCRLPSALRQPGLSVRSPRAARALLRRAGFARTVDKGVRRHAARKLRGRMWVIGVTTSHLPCDLPIRFVQGRR